ncbi:hypothetical protein RSSM_01733 [Rhodopirellula sallentina SM41]|uniref:Uncharacterized protein n=1 Tax=Rhodopirellula sallentina SM41 TaxID=1263870 RepID=M5U5R8_9BACT|nr:hypothetical protein RSSM_01733 [Rhodopirellula sallentina SM41]
MNLGKRLSATQFADGFGLVRSQFTSEPKPRADSARVANPANEASSATAPNQRFAAKLPLSCPTPYCSPTRRFKIKYVSTTHVAGVEHRE